MADRNDVRLAGFLDSEPIDPALRERYQAILEARLGSNWPLGRKTRYVLIAAAGLIGFLVAGSLSLTEPDATPRAVRGLLGLFALFGLGWATFAGWALARRRGGIASERRAASRIALGFTLAALVGIGLTAIALGKEAAAAPMLVVGLGFLVLAAVGSVQARIEEAELAVREQLLRLESRIIGAEGAAGRARGSGRDS
ncbi:hypothetical protein [Planctomyces sp. SH-PL62]|uniref:hypothetical protein n=1 Tax=Planctomyces sp. SH-PL62 TaxID=1636152 RepID=UPI00078E0DF0|nr:hypothetical protein [Planctomyces sp. SH-PL62]AMV36679.1 hypothetical protein VT85_04565 [Planctomyces sp. SH-PL62]